MKSKMKPAGPFAQHQPRSMNDYTRGLCPVARQKMRGMARFARSVAFMSCFAWTSVVCVASGLEASGKGQNNYPSLGLVEDTILSTAKLDFRGRDQAFEAATRWDEQRLRAGQHGLRAPHLVCAEYGRGHEAASGLQAFLSPQAVKPVHHSSEHGACFMVTASDIQAIELSVGRVGFDLVSVGLFPSALKIAPGVLEHGSNGRASEGSGGSGLLTTTHGSKLRMDNVQGLIVELTPGILPEHSSEAEAFLGDLGEDLMSNLVDLHSDNFWSDPALLGGEHLAIPEGALRGREWSRAATVIHELSAAADTTPGDICSWGSVAMHHASNDVLLVSGTYVFCITWYLFSRAFQFFHPYFRYYDGAANNFKLATKLNILRGLYSSTINCTNSINNINSTLRNAPSSARA